MSQPFIIKIPRVSDRTLIQTFKKLTGKYTFTGASGNAVSGIPIEGIPFKGVPSQWDMLIRQNSTLLDFAQLVMHGLVIAYYRGGANEQKSPVFDEIRISFHQNQGGPNNEDRLAIAAFLCEELRAFDPERALDGAPTAEAKHLEALHQSTLDRLEGLAEDIIRRTTETQARLNEEYAEKKRNAEEELAKRKDELEVEHAAAQSKLVAREAALDAKLKEIDDRGNTHARREIRNRMLDDVKARIQNFGVSAATERKRQPVLFGFSAIFFIFTLGLLITAAEIKGLHNDERAQLAVTNSAPSPVLDAAKTGSGQANASPTPAHTATQAVAQKQDKVTDHTELYLLWVRLSVLTLGLVGMLLYYIRWQNRWAEQHSTSEFQLQQFYIDVNRANWIIESGLEWRKETSSEIPDTILTSVTKNLFHAQNEPAPALHPADELASALLGTASKLKLKTGDSELEFDKPGKIPNKT